MSEPSILFVGELNPWGQDPYYALYHLPRHASGNRLRVHLGLPDHVYEQIKKVNLCTNRWTMAGARVAASAILQQPSWDVIVCLGRKVARAFDDLDFFERQTCGDKTMVYLPHPSGLNRIWSLPSVRERARDLMRQVAPHLPWGSEVEQTGMRYEIGPTTGGGPVCVTTTVRENESNTSAID